MKGQIDLLEEIIVDNFAGGGGASTGIELACGRPVTIAINHDPDAIMMHKTNHPFTVHMQASVWDVDPYKVCAGRKVGLAWFSPDCKHFSKAKGGQPVSKNIRGLAWIVLRWAGKVRPRVIILENVEEFQTWGPVRKGKPVKKLSGQTFRKWVGQLKALGYDVQWRELVAADYGAPTTRKRFFLIARCDGKDIVWPEPTHAPADSEEVKAGTKKPWRSAAEIIDWNLPTPSIFASREEIKAQYGITAQRPLKPNTLRRVARGIDKFVIRSPRPFLVNVNHGEGDRIKDLDGPLQTVTAKHGFGVASPVMAPALIQYHTEQSEKVRGQAVTEPVMTIDASNRYGLAACTLTKYYGNDQHGQDVQEPLHTITAKDREGVTVASLAKFYGGVTGTEISRPLPTVTAVDHNAIQTAHMIKLKGDDLGEPVQEPVPTITAGGGHHRIVTVQAAKATPGADLKNWTQIRELLNQYCGYWLDEDEVLLFRIGGEWYFMADIGLRMLTPRELYRANGFPDDYIIDHDYTGKPYGKSKQVARCGNAVPPPFATALVRANLPEWCGEKLDSMEELKKVVAV